MDNTEFNKFEVPKNQFPLSPSYLFDLHDLTETEINGVLIPWSSEINRFLEADFKVMTAEGKEYYILSDTRWSELINSLAWSTVCLLGKLSKKQSVFIPEKVLYINTSSRS